MINNREKYGKNALFVAVKYDLFQDDMTTMNETSKISLYRDMSIITDDWTNNTSVADKTNPEQWSLYQIQQHLINIEIIQMNMNNSIQNHLSDINQFMKIHLARFGLGLVRLG